MPICLRNLTIIILCFFQFHFVWGQDKPAGLVKKSLELDSLGTWPTLEQLPLISATGRFIGFNVSNWPNGESGFIFQDSAGGWKREFTSVSDCYFSADEKIVVFQKQNSLHFLSLGVPEGDRIVMIQSVKWPAGRSGEWLAYREAAVPGNLVLVNLLTNKAQIFSGIKDYTFDGAGRACLVKLRELHNGDSLLVVKWIDLETGQQRTVWSDSGKCDADQFAFDNQGSLLAFRVVRQAGGESMSSIWTYKAGSDKAGLRVKDGACLPGTGLRIEGDPQFSQNGKWIFFEMKQEELPAPTMASEQMPMLDVWSYSEQILQPDQLAYENAYRRKHFDVVVGVNSSKAILLDKDGEKIRFPDLASVTGDEIVVMAPDSAAPVIRRGNLSFPKAYYLMSLIDGRRKLFKSNMVGLLFNFSISPDGRWLVFFNSETRRYYSFEKSTGSIHEIACTGNGQFCADRSDNVFSAPAGPVGGWLEAGNRVLIYDKYDLWAVDPSQVQPALNLTRGFGARHHVKLRLFEVQQVRRIYSSGDTLLLTGFSTDTRYNGFYRQVLGSGTGVDVLTNGPYTYYRVESQKPHVYSFDDGMVPQKAQKAEFWVVKRQSAEEAPNYFATRDWKNYRRLTAFEPQKPYHWLTTRLITWKKPDGALAQGVLYLPDNFDSNARYPVIFNYYEYLSHRLYEFPQPDLTHHNINIPWFVSQGYLVFTPDVDIKPAKLSGKGIGEWALESVESAARYLSKFRFVDAKRMGLQGHSLGGWETNYIITHSHLFAAAEEAAGMTDAISDYLSLLLEGRYGEGHTNQINREVGQSRFGATLWQDKKLYINQSAVLSADFVTTPLLIVHNKADFLVAWRQSVELFLALRRLGKKAWLLQYDRGTHTVLGSVDGKDLTIRLTQFFDYYLKGAPAPRWMLDGIPASLKGVEFRYELDRTGRVP